MCLNLLLIEDCNISSETDSHSLPKVLFFFLNEKLSRKHLAKSAIGSELRPTEIKIQRETQWVVSILGCTSNSRDA